MTASQFDLTAWSTGMALSQPGRGHIAAPHLSRCRRDAHCACGPVGVGSPPGHRNSHGSTPRSWPCSPCCRPFGPERQHRRSAGRRTYLRGVVPGQLGKGTDPGVRTDVDAVERIGIAVLMATVIVFAVRERGSAAQPHTGGEGLALTNVATSWSTPQ